MNDGAEIEPLSGAGWRRALVDDVPERACSICGDKNLRRVWFCDADRRLLCDDCWRWVTKNGDELGFLLDEKDRRRIRGVMRSEASREKKWDKVSAERHERAVERGILLVAR
jgi:hypothetical protein